MDSESIRSSRRPSAVHDDEGWQRRRSAMYRRPSNYSEYVQSPGVHVSRDEADILQVQLSRRRCGNGSGRGNRDQLDRSIRTITDLLSV
jgi:hypothetical protein